MGWVSEQWRLQENICAAAKDLHDFLHKTLQGDENGPLRIVGEDVYAEGVTVRLQALRDALEEREKPGNMPIRDTR